MIPSIHYYGQAIPEGGSQMLSTAMQRYIESTGSRVMTNATVDEFLVRGGECAGIRLSDGTEISAGKAVITSLDPQQTFLRCMDESALDPSFLSMVKHFSFGDVTICRVSFPLANSGGSCSA